MVNGEMLATIVLGEAFESVNLHTYICRSKDNRETWELEGPIYPRTNERLISDSSRLTALLDGEVVAFVSYDRGQSWPEYMNIMSEPERKVFFWESKIIEFPDSQLLAVAWAYDDIASNDRPNQYALSADGGKSWTKPASTGLQGQTLTPFLLKNGQILCIYRRMDKSDLWANLSHLKEDKWVNDGEMPLWGAEGVGLTATTENMAHNFNVLRFGAPCITRLLDGTIFVAFWCVEDCVSNIRWFRVHCK